MRDEDGEEWIRGGVEMVGENFKNYLLIRGGTMDEKSIKKKRERRRVW